MMQSKLPRCGDTVTRRTAILLLGLSALFGTGAVSAGGFPSGTISLNVPVAPGGLTDSLGRVLARYLSDASKTPVIVENKPGAGGTVGMAAAAKAKADGHSLILVFQGPATVAASLYPALGYDTFKDFAPIGMVGSFDNVLVVNKDLPARDAAQLISLAKASNPPLYYASAGNGATSHLAAELFLREANIKMTHVPYRGESPALTDLASGQTAVMFSTLTAAKPFVDAGRVRVIGVASNAVSQFAPTVPTITSSGLPGFSVPGWYGLLAPKGTPEPALAYLRHALTAALADPALQAKLIDIGITPTPMRADEFLAFMQADATKWAKLIKEANIKLQ